MYQYKKDIIDKVLQQYDGVNRLARAKNNKPVYSHFYNGVGCAIGCLFTYDEADRLENTSVEKSYGTIYRLYSSRSEEPFLRDVIFTQFGFEDYDIRLLEDLQVAHDESDTVEQFLMKVKEL